MKPRQFIAYSIPELARESLYQDDLHHPRQPVGTERSEIACRSQPEGRGDRRGQNGYIESFHDKRLDECLNRELFGSVLEARGHSRNLEDRIRRVTFAQFVRLTKARGGRAPGSLRPELLSTPKPTTTNKQQNLRLHLSHLWAQASASSLPTPIRKTPHQRMRIQVNSTQSTVSICGEKG